MQNCAISYLFAINFEYYAYFMVYLSIFKLAVTYFKEINVLYL